MFESRTTLNAIDILVEAFSFDVAALHHSLRVGGAVAKHTDDQNVIAAGYLHDVVEDCPKDGYERQISFWCGDIVADLVQAVTRDKRERYDEYIERVCNSGQQAMLIKACDLVDNTDPARKHPRPDARESLAARYRKAKNTIASRDPRFARFFADGVLS